MIDLTPLDVRNKRGDFKKLMRGYDPQEVDVFLEIAAELHFEAVAAKASAHIEVRGLGRLGRFLVAAGTRGVEAEAEQRDRGDNAELLGAQLLVGGQLRPLRG